MNVNGFTIDTVNSDDERIYVDIPGGASICILRTDEGVIVDIYDAHVKDHAIATCSATWDEIHSPLDE